MAGSASRAAHDQPACGDGLNAEQIAVGQRPAGLARLDRMVVAGADDQVAALAWVPSAMVTAGPGETMTRATRSSADAAAQLAAQRVVGGHQQGVGAVRGQGDVGGRGGVGHLLGVAAVDAAVLVVLGQDRSVAARSRRLAACSQALRNRTGSASRA